MYCKYCGNANVEVGKYCSRCGQPVEASRNGWTPIAPKISSKESNRNAQQPAKLGSDTLLEPQKAGREYVNAFLVIAKVAEVFLFLPVRLLMAIFSMDWTSEDSNHKSSHSDNHRWGSAGTKLCDGDCDNCPPHYGYRYGRWYYGHGHRHGCQKGGNGGSTGRCYRD